MYMQAVPVLSCVGHGVTSHKQAQYELLCRGDGDTCGVAPWTDCKEHFQQDSGLKLFGQRAFFHNHS